MFFSWKGNNKHTPQLKGIVSVERLLQVFGRERASSIITCKAMVGEFASYRVKIFKAPVDQQLAISRYKVKQMFCVIIVSLEYGVLYILLCYLARKNGLLE